MCNMPVLIKSGTQTRHWMVPSSMLEKVGATGFRSDQVHFHFAMREVLTKACAALSGVKQKSHWVDLLVFAKHMCSFSTG